MSDTNEPAMSGKEICQRVKAGLMSFEGAVDELMKPDSVPLGRLYYTDFLWNSLGRPTDEQLLAWERQGQHAKG